MLKNDKAPEKDSVSNEMRKCSNEAIIESLQFLFKKIYYNGCSPKSWNYGFVCSIYKSGPKEDANNDRGITLSNCLGKLFNTVFHNRLEEKLQSQSVISQAQAGFRKNFGAADHIYARFSLIKKYIKKGQYLYTCFEDFRKASDSVWREVSMQKLEKTGMTEKLLMVVRTVRPKQEGILSTIFLIHV